MRDTTDKLNIEELERRLMEEQKKNPDARKNACVLMGGENDLLLHTLLENDFKDEYLYLRLVGRKSAPPNVMRYELLDLVNANEGTSVQCTPIQQTEDHIIVKRHSLTNFDLRQDLRVPIHFISHIYPVSGSWQGRLSIQSMDLSCGGVSFSCGAELEKEEEVKIVLPVADDPLVVRCQVLHVQALENNEFFYAARFVHLCGEEEAAIRKAVFDLQLKGRRRN